jgi:uncharacterized protein
MNELRVHACVACADVAFPRRLLCPACGANGFVEVAAGRGVVEQATTLHHRPGAGGGAPSCIGTVLTDAGPRVIARLSEALAPGTPVTLEVDEAGAILASAL